MNKNINDNRVSDYLDGLITFIETYCDSYKDSMDAFEFLKTTYDRLRFYYDRFDEHPRQYDFLKAIDELRSQKKATRKNLYLASGKILFHINEQDSSFFAELILQRANLYKSSEPMISDFDGEEDLSENQIETMEKLYLSKDLNLLHEIDLILEKSFKISKSIPPYSSNYKSSF